MASLRVLLVLVAILCFTSAFATRERAPTTCAKYTCATLGQSCFNIYTANYSAYQFCVDSTCNSTYNMTGTFGTCVPYPPVNITVNWLGQACTSNSGCGDDMYCRNSKCNLNYRPGANCKNDSYCSVYNNDGSVTTLCDKGKCYGLAENSACGVYSRQCAPPLSCNNKVCKAPQPLGGSCTTSDNCEQPNRCQDSASSAVPGICVTPLVAGDICKQSNNLCGGTLLCAPTADKMVYKCAEAYSLAGGLSCDDDEQCDEEFTCISGTCKPMPATSTLKDCTQDSDCITNEYCECNSATGTGGICVLEDRGNKKGARKIYSDVIKCRDKYPLSDYPSFYYKCTKQICANAAVDENFNEDEAIRKKTYPACYLKDDYSGDSVYAYQEGFFVCKSASATVQYSLAVVAITALLSLIAM